MDSSKQPIPDPNRNNPPAAFQQGDMAFPNSATPPPNATPWPGMSGPVPMKDIPVGFQGPLAKGR